MPKNNFMSRAKSVLFALLIFAVFIGTFATTASATDIKLYPGGMPFGVKFFTDGVLVVGFSDVNTKSGKLNPAYDTGLRTKDILTKANGKEIGSIDDLISVIESSNGKEFDLTYLRDGKEYTVTLKPALCIEDNKYKTGMWIRDSGAGIGTVTFIEPGTLKFGGLGHGICDVDTGELMPISHGNVTSVTINGIAKGVSGSPGELKGYFGKDKLGELFVNTERGVFGEFSSLPAEVPENALPIASSDEVQEGPAYIWCTLANNKVTKYAVEITAINRRDSATKNFSLRVTDPTLKNECGGIVQGMSGSPIIQNGKIIGAVTHVLVGDPTSGYGIFIENMLEAAS